jgi:hypothetical protein
MSDKPECFGVLRAKELIKQGLQCQLPACPHHNECDKLSNPEEMREKVQFT